MRVVFALLMLAAPAMSQPTTTVVIDNIPVNTDPMAGLLDRIKHQLHIVTDIAESMSDTRGIPTARSEKIISQPLGPDAR